MKDLVQYQIQFRFKLFHNFKFKFLFTFNDRFMIINELLKLEFFLVVLLIICMFLLALTFVILFVLLKLIGARVKTSSKQKYPSCQNESLNKKDNPYFTIGFFHPFCYSGGGGERVLWSAVKILQDTYRLRLIFSNYKSTLYLAFKYIKIPKLRVCYLHGWLKWKWRRFHKTSQRTVFNRVKSNENKICLFEGES